MHHVRRCLGSNNIYEKKKNIVVQIIVFGVDIVLFFLLCAAHTHIYLLLSSRSLAVSLLLLHFFAFYLLSFFRCVAFFFRVSQAKTFH